MRVEGGEVIVLSRDARGSSGAGMEYFSVNPLGRVDPALDHRDLAVKGIVDVGAGLEMTPLIKVQDGVVVGVGDVILHPVTLEHTTGVLFVVAFFQGIFYCRNTTQQ